MTKADDLRGACGEYETLLEDLLNGELDPGVESRLTAHLASCGACRESLADARAGAQLLHLGHEATPDPGRVFTTRVMAAIRAEEERRAAAGSFWRPLESLAWRFSFSAALVVALLVGYDILGPVTQQTEVSSTQQSEVREIFPEPAQQPASRDDVLLTIAERNNGR
jgi:anti-sigma factor RsiW